MEFRVEEIAPCRKRVTVVVPPERVREELDGQYKEINKAFALPGFRPGHAPRRLLEARFGSKVAEEVKQKIAESAYEKMIEERKVAPLRRPSVDLADSKVDADIPFEFAFEVTTRPEFSLPEWKGREVRVPPLSVTDADVDAAVDRMRAHEATLVPADDGTARGDDVVVVDWVAKDGDVALGSSEGAHYRLGNAILDGMLVEGIDEALSGAKEGTKAVVAARAAADDPRTTLAGREFKVFVEVRDVKRVKPADLDAEFLKRHDYDDVDEMRQDLRRKILRAKERERDRLAEDRLIDDLLAHSAIPLPEEVVSEAVATWAERRRISAQAEGVDEETVTKALAADEGDVRSSVEGDLRRHFVLERIAEAVDAKVSEQELVGAVEQIARDSGRAPGEVLAHFREEPHRLMELRDHLRNQKARDALRKAAAVIEEAPAAGPAKPEKAEKPGKGK